VHTRVILTSGSLLLELAVSVAITGLFASILTTAVLSQQQEISDIKTRKDVLVDLITNKDKVQTPLSITPCITKHETSKTWQTASVHSATIDWLSVDIDEVLKRGKDCDGSMLSNSFTVAHDKEQNLDIPVTNSITSIDALSGRIIVGTKTEDQASPNLFIYNNKLLTHSLTLESSINALDATDSTIFAALDNSTHQVAVVDKYNSTHQFSTQYYTLPGVAGSYPAGRSIVFYNNKLYVGTHRTAGREFHIYDASDRDALIWLGSLEVNHNINSILIREPYAFLGTSGNTKNVIVLDISSPRAISQLATLALTGNEDTTSMYLLGNHLLVGRKKATSVGSSELTIVDITNPQSPTVVNGYKLSATVIDIYAQHKTAFVLTQNPHQLLSIEFLDKDTPTQAKEILTTFNDPPTTLEYHDASLYIGTQNIFTTLYSQR